MPIYEYRCNNCGAISEILQGVTMKEVPVKCSVCGGEDLFRLISRHSGGRKGVGAAPENPCSGLEKKDFADCLPRSCYGRYTIGE